MNFNTPIVRIRNSNHYFLILLNTFRLEFLNCFLIIQSTCENNFLFRFIVNCLDKCLERVINFIRLAIFIAVYFL